MNRIVDRAQTLATTATRAANQQRPWGVDHCRDKENAISGKCGTLSEVATMLDPTLATDELVSGLQKIAQQLPWPNDRMESTLKFSLVEGTLHSLARCLNAGAAAVGGQSGAALTALCGDGTRKDIIANLCTRAADHEGPCGCENSIAKERGVSSKLDALQLINSLLDPQIADPGVIAHAKSLAKKVDENPQHWNSTMKIGLLNAEFESILEGVGYHRT